MPVDFTVWTLKKILVRGRQKWLCNGWLTSCSEKVTDLYETTKLKYKRKLLWVFGKAYFNADYHHEWILNTKQFFRYSNVFRKWINWLYPEKMSNVSVSLDSICVMHKKCVCLMAHWIVKKVLMRQVKSRATLFQMIFCLYFFNTHRYM